MCLLGICVSFYFFKIPYSYCLLTFIFGYQLDHIAYGVIDFYVINNVKKPNLPIFFFMASSFAF